MYVSRRELYTLKYISVLCEVVPWELLNSGNYHVDGEVYLPISSYSLVVLNLVVSILLPSLQYYRGVLLYNIDFQGPTNLFPENHLL